MLLTVPVKIDGRQEQEETSVLLYTHVACAGILVQYLAKLVFYEDTPPNLQRGSLRLQRRCQCMAFRRVREDT